MKMLLVTIQPNKLQAVREALQAVGVHRLTVLDAQGYGRQKGHSAVYSGVEYQIHLLRKVSLEIMVNDDFVDRAIETICKAARTGTTGSIGDGKIFVVPALESITIDDNVRGPSAV
ncbi:MAG: P-II family nitrogen regulator [Pirellula sp.]|jgi:nitrogen regulatory protein P-II 1|nr:P-II family nitrogen regulator [Planctomycetota bacterium]